MGLRHDRLEPKGAVRPVRVDPIRPAVADVGRLPFCRGYGDPQNRAKELRFRWRVAQ